ncbi:ATP-binding protein [Paraburkholderia rhynchosiae]
MSLAAPIQLLSILVVNAIAHGDRHQPINVNAHVEDDDLIISVTNRGLPVGAKNPSLVFAPYWRPAGAPAGSGLGLDLLICKQIVVRMAGHSPFHRRSRKVRDSLPDFRSNKNAIRMRRLEVCPAGASVRCRTGVVFVG